VSSATMATNRTERLKLSTATSLLQLSHGWKVSEGSQAPCNAAVVGTHVAITATWTSPGRARSGLRSSGCRAATPPHRFPTDNVQPMHQCPTANQLSRPVGEQLNARTADMVPTGARSRTCCELTR
jgi:hypothetical protein